MSTVVSKIEFPRNSPDNIITMSETLLSTHDANPKKVNIPSENVEAIREKVALAKQKREEAKRYSDLSVKLNGEADKMLGIAIGQTLEDRTTVAGNIAFFRDHAKLAYVGDIEKLKDYGFSVTLSQRAPRLSKKTIEKILKKKE